MILFVDTSAFLAVLDADDAFHPQAQAHWAQWHAEEVTFVTSNYVIVETLALVQRRLGMDAVMLFCTDVLPVVRVEWIDAALHDTALEVLLGIGSRGLSLVDCTSFTLMRRWGLHEAFTFDRHFAGQGFTCLPG